MSSETTAKKDVQKLQRAIIDGLEDVKGQDIVVFDTELAVYEPMTFSYGLLRTNEWERHLGAIERERSRVTLRAQQAVEEGR